MMRRYLSLVVSMSFLAGFIGCKKSEQAKTTEEVAEIVNPETAATVSGKIKFVGVVPKVKMIQVTADAYCTKQHTKGSIPSEEVVVNKDKTLSNVLVYVKKGLEGRKFPTPKEPAVLDQSGCWYKPHIIAVMVNQPILVRNSDETLHNIHSMPKINQGFNFGQPVKGMESTKYFTQEEFAIPIKCDVHPWMGGYLSVLAHPYFFVTGDDGSFELGNLPPGEYEIEAWQEKLGTQSQIVKVGEKESKTVEFTFKSGNM